MNKPKLIVIVGLPGSGKTYNLKSHVRDHNVVYHVDSFKKNAHDHSSRFWSSRHLADLLRHLIARETCLITDIHFCRPDAREEAESFLRACFPDIDICWLFQENAPDKCERNIRRSREEVMNRLNKLAEFRDQYDIPPGAEVRPVYDGG